MPRPSNWSQLTEEEKTAVSDAFANMSNKDYRDFVEDEIELDLSEAVSLERLKEIAKNGAV
jgi:hypothetical protein